MRIEVTFSDRTYWTRPDAQPGAFQGWRDPDDRPVSALVTQQLDALWSAAKEDGRVHSCDDGALRMREQCACGAQRAPTKHVPAEPGRGEGKEGGVGGDQGHNAAPSAPRPSEADPYPRVRLSGVSSQTAELLRPGASLDDAEEALWDLP